MNPPTPVPAPVAPAAPTVAIPKPQMVSSINVPSPSPSPTQTPDIAGYIRAAQSQGATNDAIYAHLKSLGYVDSTGAITTTKQVAPTLQPNALQRTGSAFESDIAPAVSDLEGGGNVGEAASDLSKGNTAAGLEEGTLGVASDAVKDLFAPIAAPIQSLLTSARAQDLTDSSDGVDLNSPQAQQARQALQTWAQQNPTLAKTLGDAFNVGTAALGSGALDTSVSDAAGSVIQPIKNAVGTIKETASSVVGGAKNAVGLGVTTPEDDTSAIEDTISPKLNSKEVQNAIAEGRVTRSPDTGVKVALFGKQPDIVTQSDEVKQAAQTIANQIPNAAKMTDTQLYSALGDKTEEIAQNLQSDMENVPVKQATTGKVFDAWSDLKTSQQEEPEFDNFAGSAKSQAKFESYLKPLQWDIQNPETGEMQSPTPKTLDDIWQARKDYDSSIAPNVKSATTNSAPTLQWQKTMWLQNRAILNDAINDTALGLGNESQQAFSDMSDMYTAQQNILSKASLTKEGSEGLLPSDKHGWLKFGLSVGGAYAADKVVKAMTGLGF